MVLSASNLPLFSVEGRGKDVGSYRAPKAPGSLVLRMMQSSSRRASKTLIMEREREREGTRKEEQEQTKETRHAVRTRKATALEVKRGGHSTARVQVSEKLVVP